MTEQLMTLLLKHGIPFDPNLNHSMQQLESLYLQAKQGEYLKMPLESPNYSLKQLERLRVEELRRLCCLKGLTLNLKNWNKLYGKKRLMIQLLTGESEKVEHLVPQLDTMTIQDPSHPVTFSVIITSINVKPNNSAYKFKERLMELTKQLTNSSTSSLAAIQEPGTSRCQTQETMKILKSTRLGFPSSFIYAEDLSPKLNSVRLGWDSLQFYVSKPLMMETLPDTVLCPEYLHLSSSCHLLADMVKLSERYQAKILKHKDTGMEFIFISFHNNNIAKLDIPARLKSAKLQLAIFLYLSRVNGDLPCIIAGDFNTEISTILQDEHLWHRINYKTCPDNGIDGIIAIWSKSNLVKTIDLDTVSIQPSNNIAHPLIQIKMTMSS